MKSPKLVSSAARTTRAALTALLVSTLACSGGGTAEPSDPEPTPTVSFELTLSSEKLPVLTGDSATIEVTLTRAAGFDGAVTLTPAGLPPQATASFSPETIATGQTKSMLTVVAPAGTPHSLPTAVTVRGAAGDKQVTKSLTVTITGAPGTLDTSFGGGKVIVPVGTSDDYANAMAVQPDGKIIVAGRAAEHLGDFAVVRLERDGTLDTTFGPASSPGKVLTDFAGASETAYAVAVQPDGRIVVAGTSAVTGSGQDFAVARYNTDGSLDAGFGTGGKLTTSFSADADTAYALLLQADGKIVVGGDSSQGSSATGVDFALARYNTDGSLDTGFGADGTGKVTTSLAAFGARDSIYALALQTVGGEARIVAAGGEGDFTVARYLANGTLDATFGAAGTGKVTAVMGSTIGAARAVRLTADDKIVLAGHVSHDFALVRLTSGGQLDTSFGSPTTPGKVVTAVQTSNWDEAQGLAIEADGKIVAAGWAYEGNSSAGNFAVVRYQVDGQLDTSFGGTGMVITPVAPGTGRDQGSAVLLQTDDRIPAVRVLVAGQANGSSNSEFAVTRYWR